MNELIKITETNDGILINARDLWSFLGIKKKFSDWIKSKIIKFNLIENIDYIVFPLKGKNLLGGRQEIEYGLKQKTALQICITSDSFKSMELMNLIIESKNKPTLQISLGSYERFKTKTLNGIIYVDAFDICKYKPNFDPIKWFNTNIKATEITLELEKQNLPLIIYLDSIYFHIDLAYVFEHYLYKYKTPELIELKINNQKALS